MKILISAGVTLIKSTPAFRGRGYRIPAWDNSVNEVNFGTVLCASGKWLAYADAELVDGILWYYPQRLFPDQDSALVYFNAQYTYFIKANGQGALGEWFNYVSRPDCFTKLTATGMAAFIAAH